MKNIKYVGVCCNIWENTVNGDLLCKSFKIPLTLLYREKFFAHIYLGDSFVAVKIKPKNALNGKRTIWFTNERQRLIC